VFVLGFCKNKKIFPKTAIFLEKINMFLNAPVDRRCIYKYILQIKVVSKQFVVPKPNKTKINSLKKK